jgi:hypothetical protein
VSSVPIASPILVDLPACWANAFPGFPRLNRRPQQPAQGFGLGRRRIRRQAEIVRQLQQVAVGCSAKKLHLVQRPRKVPGSGKPPAQAWGGDPGETPRALTTSSLVWQSCLRRLPFAESEKFLRSFMMTRASRATRLGDFSPEQAIQYRRSPSPLQNEIRKIPLDKVPTVPLLRPRWQLVPDSVVVFVASERRPFSIAARHKR